MERFALCCKVLYDKDILDKHKELEYIRDPVLYYENYEDWEDHLDTMYIDIHEGIKDAIMSIGSFESMKRNYIIPMKQSKHIRLTLTKALMKLTRKEKWSEDTAHDVMDGIESCVRVMGNEWTGDRTNVINTLCKLIRDRLGGTDDIIWDDGSHQPFPISGKLCRIARFQCQGCGEDILLGEHGELICDLCEWGVDHYHHLK
jgi:hypothetical protein